MTVSISQVLSAARLQHQSASLCTVVEKKESHPGCVATIFVMVPLCYSNDCVVDYVVRLFLSTGFCQAFSFVRMMLPLVFA